MPRLELNFLRKFPDVPEVIEAALCSTLRERPGLRRLRINTPPLLNNLHSRASLEILDFYISDGGIPWSFSCTYPREVKLHGFVRCCLKRCLCSTGQDSLLYEFMLHSSSLKFLKCLGVERHDKSVKLNAPNLEVLDVDVSSNGGLNQLHSLRLSSSVRLMARVRHPSVKDASRIKDITAVHVFHVRDLFIGNIVEFSENAVFGKGGQRLSCGKESYRHRKLRFHYPHSSKLELLLLMNLPSRMSPHYLSFLQANQFEINDIRIVYSTKQQCLISITLPAEIEKLACDSDVYDPSYRKSVKLNPEEFVTDFHPANYEILDIVRDTLVPNATSLRAELHKLTLYRAGDYFKTHITFPVSLQGVLFWAAKLNPLVVQLWEEKPKEKKDIYVSQNCLGFMLSLEFPNRLVELASFMETMFTVCFSCCGPEDENDGTVPYCNGPEGNYTDYKDD
ncbi:hypothetical protein SELMODRAFT_421212 [Selaginella moellendorffii]|uniref:FBD domain-containing protein n=1 Tax=Selaginella moellendorffii TaxID=88036 RepID=D8SED2_SELML|nr:hypothetical protein SELMODRAFT_421212 [Selaginella moellendorffii]